MLRNEFSSRITFAAVFVPHDKTRPVQYVMPEGVRVPSGFVSFNREIHKNKKLGKFCCGNCYAEQDPDKKPIEVEITHRRATTERIDGGEAEGYPATFAALANTIEQHTEYCQKRRKELVESDDTLKPDVVFKVNIKETYTLGRVLKKAVRAHKVEHDNPQMEGRSSIPISEDISEILKKSARLSHRQGQQAIFKIDANISTLVDGDGWQDLVREMLKKHLKKPIMQAHRIFHVTNLHSKNLTEFNIVAQGDKKIKIPLQQFEFKDRNGHLHIIQPSIETSNIDIKKLFEAAGDYLVIGKFRYLQKKSDDENIPTIHIIKIDLNSPKLGVELYNTPKRKMRDLEVMEVLQRDFDKLSIIDPKLRAKPKPKTSSIATFPAAQMDLFGSLSL